MLLKIAKVFSCLTWNPLTAFNICFPTTGIFKGDTIRDRYSDWVCKCVLALGVYFMINIGVEEKKINKFKFISDNSKVLKALAIGS